MREKGLDHTFLSFSNLQKNHFCDAQAPWGLGPGGEVYEQLQTTAHGPDTPVAALSGLQPTAPLTARMQEGGWENRGRLQETVLTGLEDRKL